MELRVDRPGRLRGNTRHALELLLGRGDVALTDHGRAQAKRLAEALAAKPLATWLELFDGEDVSVGPVATLEEAAAELGP